MSCHIELGEGARMGGARAALSRQGVHKNADRMKLRKWSGAPAIFN